LFGSGQPIECRTSPGWNLYTVFGEGARGSLTKKLIDRYRLNQHSDHQKYGLDLPQLLHAEPVFLVVGMLVEAVAVDQLLGQRAAGWPLPNKAGGGSWLYHFDDHLVSVGFVTHLNYENPTLGLDLPQLLHAEPVFLVVGMLVEAVAVDQLLGQRAYGLGVKELWQVKPEKFQPGLVRHSMGWPLPNKAAGLVRQRPAHRVPHQPRLEFLGLDLPQLLHAEVFGEGARGSLTKKLIDRYRLNQHSDHQKYGLGVNRSSGA
jgi:flavin-dependent dehydrogenase